MTSSPFISSSGPPCGPLPDLMRSAAGEVRLFVHSANSIPNAATVRTRTPSLDRLAERAVLLAAPDDIVCLPAPLDPDFQAFLRHQGLGPRPEDLVAVSVPDDGRCLTERLLADPPALERIARIAGQRPVVLHPFYASPAEFELAEKIAARTGNRVTVLGGHPDVVRHVYHKHHVRAEARQIGIPVAPGEVVELPLPDRSGRRDTTPLATAVSQHIRRTGRIIVRGSSSSTGSSTFVAENTSASVAALLNAIAERDDETTYLVDSMYDATVSPNIQTFIEPTRGRVSLASACDQLLRDGFSYQGNRYPSAAVLLPEMTAAALSLSSWLASIGFTGLAGFDFVEYRNGNGRPDFCFAELNPRVNGAAFPTTLREHLNARRPTGAPAITSCLSTGIPSSARTFTQVARFCGTRLFSASTGRGIFPYYLGLLPAGILHAAFLGTSIEDVESLHAEFAAVPPVDGENRSSPR